jgi:hypothetical protein
MSQRHTFPVDEIVASVVRHAWAASVTLFHQLRRLLIVVLLSMFAAAIASRSNADETPARIFHIGIVAGLQRSLPEHAAFEERLRELGYVEGRNLAIDFVQENDPDRLATAVGEFARRGVDVIVTGGQDILNAAITATAARSPRSCSGQWISTRWQKAISPAFPIRAAI